MGNSKIIYGNQTLLDLTSDTVTPSDVRQGVTFHDKSGESKVGTYTPSSIVDPSVFDLNGNPVYTWEQAIANNNALLKDSNKRYIIIVQNSIESVNLAACVSIQKAIIADGVTSLINSAFQDCSNLESIIIPDSVVDIYNRAFFNCSSLKQIRIPSGVSTIYNRTFEDCTSLDLYVPSTVTDIRAGIAINFAFKNVPHITYHGTATGAPWGALSMN